MHARELTCFSIVLTVFFVENFVMLLPFLTIIFIGYSASLVPKWKAIFLYPLLFVVRIFIAPNGLAKLYFLAGVLNADLTIFGNFEMNPMFVVSKIAEPTIPTIAISLLMIYAIGVLMVFGCHYAFSKTKWLLIRI